MDHLWDMPDEQLRAAIIAMGRKKGYAPRTILGAIARLAVRRMEQWAEEGKDPADVQRVREIYGQVQRELQALETGAYQGAGE